MNEFFTPENFSTLTTVIIIPMLAILTKYIQVFLKSRVLELEQKVENENLMKYIRIAEDAIETAVVSVNQTFVDEMKKQGIFDQASMEKAFHLAKDKAVSIMDSYAKETLKDAYSDVDAWLENKLEFYVNKNKK